MPDKITDKELEQLVRLYKTAAHPIDIAIYKAVKELAIGDVVDLEGFLYWYEGVNPHITSVKK